MTRTTPIQVLIVDDSASVRHILTSLLVDDPSFEVAAVADPFAAARRMQDQLPDVIILDIEMPRMDGLTFLRKIMAQRPIPVVICSTLTEAGSKTLFDALEAGAVDVLPKPRADTRQFLLQSGALVREAVKAAALSKVGQRKSRPMRIEEKLSADVIMPPPVAWRHASATDFVVCIGISTGGTESLREVLQMMPAACPPLVVVQHMPEKFTAAFARRLDGMCAMEVKEAEDGDAVRSGRVLIAPGNLHMLLQRSGSRYHVAIKEGPPVARHRPSVDVLFRSAAQHAGPNALGIIMTGMGDDGANGLLEMRRAGAHTLAQDEESCVVFGMPKEAIDRGAAERIVPLDRIHLEIMRAGAAAQMETTT